MCFVSHGALVVAHTARGEQVGPTIPRAANRSVPRYLATRMEVADRGIAMRLGAWDCAPGAGEQIMHLKRIAEPRCILVYGIAFQEQEYR